MASTDHSEVARTEPPVLRFEPAEAPRPFAGAQWVPDDALVLWEYERADLHRRVVGVVVGNRLKLIRVSAGHETALDVLAEVVLAEGHGVARPEFLTRSALVFWGERRAGVSGVTRTFVLGLGARLVMVRVTGNELAPQIEVLHTLELGG